MTPSRPELPIGALVAGGATGPWTLVLDDATANDRGAARAFPAQREVVRMRKILRASMVGALAAGAIAVLAGVAWSVIPSADGEIWACYTKSSGDRPDRRRDPELQP